MGFAQRFEQGFKYVGGASKPFVVSKAAIEGWAKDHGFTNVIVASRDDLPLFLQNEILQAAGQPEDDWDTLVTADHLGPGETIELPAKPTFLLAVPLSTAPQAPPPQPAAPAAPGQQPAPTQPSPAPLAPTASPAIGIAAGVIVIVGSAATLAYVLWRERRRRR